MKPKIATPISKLFNNSSLQKEILELSDVVELREYSNPIESDLPRIYHCDWSVVDVWSAEEVEKIANIIRSNNPQLVTFHVNSCYFKPPIEDDMFVPSGEKLAESELIGNARRNLEKLETAVGRKFQKGVENTNYYPTGAYEIVTTPEFLNKLMSEFDMKFLLDMAHAQITAINKKIALEDYLGRLNLDRAIQMHISRPDKNETLAKDIHESLEDDDWDMVRKLVSRCPNLQYMTLEYYKDDKKLILMLKKLKEILA
ncbi:MAG: hypothetical protein A3C85_03975 [Candidatus Doudnabacteria bacterium RIFCSPHIGHO2_02_FULL_48_21]|uniref:Xylose isomerase-like TIM barrel domain-containing protein n=1 Tax=Candidatus Doudnabacteria bacterium RIFCSPLOWO2_02_FULL_48_13 TaxID=1817845 RepID=A0A1F5QC14_9BACT|nr:MAG: hypothetical protein A3K05_03985 [Candidatus Doudnabacteria bacterium RIFCSPHIGHO2_01_48_18]OGE91174.1 MAG: hypothetical protein A3F44_02495 [Candidatus Doudnabacteria bacterium RIFCSPHIGHO2_12_FULL_47_25]OGE93614.1 MAG: hypothetical protein A3C85_03975 [Candidatus Doudnabacteria bacterium RIFCSPHIGHO2_02_FULL_48_21]OGE99310.1 MAG: hypothetical protein A3J05_00115 [Candidatus Doudnabacteria bacterium RIFCSPLOWO2_02_FULL_48_13]OGF01724.1 MAG: hypothetical protein A3G07_01350 [Candidatus 